jgi:hypothetical protein
MDVRQVRKLAWRNFAEVVRLTGTRELLPEGLRGLIG